MNCDPKITLQKECNAEVFQETMRICREGSYVAKSGLCIDLPPIAEVLTSSVFHEIVSDARNVPQVTGSSVDVVKKDCIDVAQELVSQGLNPVMLNMASRRCPGGGALNGARAQEETLFRRSNLCVSLYQFDEYHADLLGIPLGKGRASQASAWAFTRAAGGMRRTPTPPSRASSRTTCWASNRLPPDSRNTQSARGLLPASLVHRA